MHRSHFADRVRAFLLAAALVSALICPQALAADAAGSGGCAHGHTLTTCRGGKSVCAVCGETVDIRAAQYTGWLTVEGTADRMYFLSGEHVTGWQQLDGGTYHFDDDGIVHDTETVDTRTCTTNGYAITTCRTCGETCRSAVLRYAGHSWDADHVCTKCGTQGKNIADAQVKTAPAVYNGKDAVCAVAVTYQGRQLTVRTDEADVDGCISYTNNTRVGLGTVSIRGMRDFYGTVSAQYEILPGGVRDAAAAEIGQKQVRLDWTAAAGAENYRVEMSADGGSTWTALPLTAKPVCIVTGLAPATAYTFRLAGCTQVDGRWYFSPYYSNTVTVTTLPEGAFAPSELLGTIDAQVDGRTVTGLSMDAAQYLFLPASADLSRLAVTVHTQNCTNPTVELQGSKGIEPLGETVNITELAAADDGLYTLTVRINGEAAGTLCVAQSENLSALYITSEDPSAQGRAFVDAGDANAAAQLLLAGRHDVCRYRGGHGRLAHRAHRANARRLCPHVGRRRRHAGADLHIHRHARLHQRCRRDDDRDYPGQSPRARGAPGRGGHLHHAGPDRGQPVRPLRRGADGAGDHPRRAPLCQRGLHRLLGKRPGVRSVPRRQSLSGQQIHRYAARGQLGAQRH